MHRHKFFHSEIRGCCIILMIILYRARYLFTILPSTYILQINRIDQVRNNNNNYPLYKKCKCYIYMAVNGSVNPILPLASYAYDSRSGIACEFFEHCI